MIFPESFAAQLWDSIIIIITFYNALWIPYEFGISGGYLNITSSGLIVFNAVVDVCFLGMFRHNINRRGSSFLDVMGLNAV